MSAPSPLATLFSLTAADALGAATEFQTPQNIRQRFGEAGFDTYQSGSPFGFVPGEATDDSQMTVATLLGYARGAGPSGVLAALEDWIGTSPPDVGGLTRSALAHGTLDGGYRAWQASGKQSAGNGGLMRIAAVWLAGWRDEALLIQATQVTALTHADPRCVLASVFFVGFLERLAHGVPYEEAAARAWRVAQDFPVVETLVPLIADLDKAGYSQALQAALPQVEQVIHSGVRGLVTSQSGYVLDTLEAALAHGQGASWLACIQPAALMGDDSDTVACVTGAVAGARGLEVSTHLLPDLRLGHSWPGWERAWTCTEHFPALLGQARAQLNR